MTHSSADGRIEKVKETANTLLEWEHFENARVLLPQIMAANPVHRTLNRLMCAMAEASGHQFVISRHRMRALLTYCDYKFRSKISTLHLSAEKREARVNFCRALLKEDEVTGGTF